ncbi:hypothetical protein [Pseudohongiella nitratireducens]|uniref:capsular polysaccharide export protein, LipB/KpsS family n=1 Tax=Pseudohongiella nitratireducens TaxID=1768907 RepID=UPI0030EC3D3F|tara:strand:+ start:2124 stop:3599 length:1476 start_codon:yes stop_codon:yes gene_type:complete
MNLLCSGKIDNFWLEVLLRVEAETGAKPVYWVGEKASELSIKNCFVHDVWEAFALDGGISDWENIADVVDMKFVTRTEYYNYLKILDRVDFDNKFSFSERDELFKRQLSYWHFVLTTKQIDFVFFSNAPHLPYDYPLYLCAKKMGLKMLMFNVTSLRGWHYLTDRIGSAPLESRVHDFSRDEVDTLTRESIEQFLFSKFQQPWYMEAQSKKQRSFRLKLPAIPIVGLLYLILERLIKRVLRRPISNSVKYKTIKFYEGVYSKKEVGLIDLHVMKVVAERKKKRLKKEYVRLSQVFDPSSIGPYVYFAIHYQPELTTTPLGDEYSDQFHVIRHLSKSLPKGIILVVKEHPSQFSRVLYGEQGRHLGCWEQVSKLDNVVLADLSISSISLVKHSKAVATITGTAGWESLVNGKACLYFGGAWYQAFTQATKVDFSNLAQNLEKALQGTTNAVTIDDVIENLAKKAIKTDIHGVYRGEMSRDYVVTADYLIRAL